jgi:hypothetical protein
MFFLNSGSEAYYGLIMFYAPLNKLLTANSRFLYSLKHKKFSFLEKMNCNPYERNEASI